jgi:hypothetical protein
MIVYLAMLTFLCILAMGSLFLPNHLGSVRRVISLMGYTAMCLFIGLRDHVGGDWAPYSELFSALSRAPFIVVLIIVEPLYGLCNRLVYMVGGDIHLVNLVCATILLVCLFNFSRLVDMDSNVLLFIAAPYLLFVVGMGYTRQSVAVGLILNGIGHLRHGRDRKFYLFVCLATLFHYSAIVLILLWWVNSLKRTAALVVALAAVSPVVYVIILASSKYSIYVNNDPSVQSHGVWFRILIILLALFVVFAQKLHWAKESQLRTMIIRGAITLGLIAVLSLFLSTIADRICLYLFFIYILAVGSVIRYARLPFKYLSLYFVICLSYGVFFIWFGLSNFAAAAWFPYGMSLYGNS